MYRSEMRDYLASVAGNFSLEVFDSLGLRTFIEKALDEGGGREKKECVLKSPLVMVLVLLMNVHRHLSIVNVFKLIVSSLRNEEEELSLTLMTEEAVYHARSRVGVTPMRILFEQTAALCQATPTFHGLRTVIADGVHFLVPDTKKNSPVFGRPTSDKDKAAFPQLKGVTLLGSETREVIAAAFGPYNMAEGPAVEQLVKKHLKAADLLIIDRGLPSFSLFTIVKSKGAHFLARISSVWKPKWLKDLGPGDSLVLIKDLVPITSRKQRRQRNQTHFTAYMTVRMIEYTFESTGEVIRLLTDLLDTEQYSALELAELYHERWEIELSYDELKTHLETIPHGAAPTVFRSHTPQGVLQEAYAMLTVYNLIRHLMAKAAEGIRVPADQISFVGTLNVIRMAIPRHAQVKDALKQRRLEKQLLVDIQECVLDRPRRKRRYARVVKIKFIRFTKKRPEHGQQYFDFKEEIRIGNPHHNTKAA